MTREDVLLQTRNHTYEAPPDPSPSTSAKAIPTRPLTITQPPIDVMPKMVKGPLQHARPNSRGAHSYNIVDYMAQSSSAISALEVLQMCSTSRKALLSALVAINPSDSCLMVFDFDKATPQLPSIITFQIHVLVQNISNHHCIVDEGASMCIMSKSF